MGVTSIVIENIAAEVREYLKDAEGGHDWWHIFRVWQNAMYIAEEESNMDLEVVSLAALLHDIADSKFHGGNEDIGPQKAKDILSRHHISPHVTEHVINIIRHISFKNSIDGQDWSSPELKVVQDADRLDAIGAIGIARAFNYGGYKNRAIFDPGIPPVNVLSKEAYKKSSAPTINHFYEKLFKLKDLMNTETGSALARKRHHFMIQYLNQFYDEIGSAPEWHQQ